MARNRKPAKSSHHRDQPGPAKARRHSREPSATKRTVPRQQPVETAPPARLAPAKARLAEKTGLLLSAEPDNDYALLDSGDGQKLEQYGALTLVRPEGQAIWQKRLPPQRWKAADAVFTGDTDEEGLGRWQFKNPQQGETFPMEWDGLQYWGRFTSFRHTGVFPEQAAHWRFMEQQLARLDGQDGPPRVLNLFGYTGLASLVAARAGAHVTHVDASKKAIGWARENQERAGLSEKPIRWICEDAVRFCEREVRRGNRYEGILLDPPAYGRGPKGEVWQLFENLPHMADLCRELVSPRAGFVVLTAYTIRASFLAIHELMQEVFGDRGGLLESGELTIATRGSERRISTSMFSRWTAGTARPGTPAREGSDG
ncbi:class I SAM-dependent methyltransferase [Salaquimonas pukyongi]|uniref:class I SAM-dependent methyltransferase n=1 Tax=Salaquimonas pukyongi TaxID=2712698 RepID=UPI00096BBECA|nr:class I SAM-dependent methyltransferase [Salaquimonas pukyongi]